MRLQSVLSVLAAIALLTGFGCLLLARCLPGDRAPVSVDPLYSDPSAVPFSTVRPPDFEPSNPYTSDTAMVFYPWLVFMAKEVASGELPIWSPLCGGGLPMMANLSSAVFFPTTWLSFVPEIGVARGMFWAAFAKLLVAGVSGFFLLRRLGAGFPGALLAGIGFAAFGYQVVWLNYSLSNVSCLLPGALWAADRFAERRSLGRGSVLAAVLALQFLGGHAETSLALGIAVVLWLGCVGGASTLIRFAPYGLLSLAWCAFQLLPFVEYLAVSQGRVERLEKGDPIPLHVAASSWFGIVLGAAAVAASFGAWRMIAGPPSRPSGSVARGGIAGLLLAGCFAAWDAMGGRSSAATLLLDPDAFGSPVRDGAYSGPEMYPDVNGGYVGVAILSFGLLYALVGKNRAIARFVACAGILGFGFAANLEPLASLLRSIPPLDLAAGTRMLPLFACAAIVGAGLAVGELGSERGPVLRASGLRAIVAAACVAVVSVATPDRQPSPAVGDGAPHEPRVSAPSAGASLAPTATSRKGSSLRIELRAESGGARPERAGFRIGGRLLPARVERDPQDSGWIATATWNATRAEAGVYRVAAEFDGRRGPPIEFLLRREPELRADAWLRIGFALLAILVAAVAPRFAGVLPLVAAFELWRFGEPYNPASRIADVFPRTELTDFLERAAAESTARGDGPIRVLFEDVILQPNMNQAYGIEVVRAYDQLEFHPFRRFLAQWVSGNLPSVAYNRDTVALEHPLADFLNLTHVVTGRPLERPGFDLVFESRGGAGGRVYANRDASKRAFLAERAVDARTTPSAELLALDPRSTAFLEGEAPATTAGGTVRFGRCSAARLELFVDSPGPGLLVLADNDFPGWEARVDGVPVRILRSHVAFRAVAVPQGTSRVTFEYRPSSLRAGVILAALGAVAVAVAIAVARRRRLRSETP